VGFDGIIAALLAKRCDAILAGMTDTAQPMKQLLLRVPEHPAERSRCAHGCVSANIADNRRRRPNSQPSHELSGRSSTCDTPSAATPQSVSVGKKTAIRNSAASSQMSRITRRTAPGSHHHVRTWLDSVIDLGVPVVLHLADSRLHLTGSARPYEQAFCCAEIECRFRLAVELLQIDVPAQGPRPQLTDAFSRPGLSGYGDVACASVLTP
jgi:hypothetical protein